ncbi:hypothetical protein PsYK624_034810 [Phanerochaete sordida]|uniref:Uncharacterized protein n=1 Tax=Phanerochaete sordida TaxID=48140 RepID=A0A9P3G352_9APHY|nr:hypothetical protein PsYK624_034810 [Phanerochaete sordida]
MPNAEAVELAGRTPSSWAGATLGDALDLKAANGQCAREDIARSVVGAVTVTDDASSAQWLDGFAAGHDSDALKLGSFRTWHGCAVLGPFSHGPLNARMHTSTVGHYWRTSGAGPRSSKLQGSRCKASCSVSRP